MWLAVLFILVMITLGSAPLIGSLARKAPPPNLPFSIVGACLCGRAYGCAKVVSGFVHYGCLPWAFQPAGPSPLLQQCLGFQEQAPKRLMRGPAKVPTWPGIAFALAAWLSRTVSASRNVDFPASLSSDWHEA